MATVRISKYRKLVQAERFAGSFFINCSNDILFWTFGRHEGWQTDGEHGQSYDASSTEWAIWLMNLSPKNYRFQVIRPDWILKINGALCERGFYDTVDVVWQNVELAYRNYEFSFLFEENDIDIDNEAPLPRPKVTAVNIKSLDQIFPLK
jgi:hypothetical protein